MFMALAKSFGNGSSPAVQDGEPRTLSEPLDALSNTAESATEAASEFASWIASGSREALVALALAVSMSVLLWFMRWGVIRLMRQLPRNDDYSLAAIFNRIVRRFRIYFMVATALAPYGLGVRP